MENIITYTLSVFISFYEFFCCYESIANTPIFLGLTEGNTKENKKKIAKTALITAFIIVVAFIIAGKYIFELLSQLLK